MRHRAVSIAVARFVATVHQAGRYLGERSLQGEPLLQRRFGDFLTGDVDDQAFEHRRPSVETRYLAAAFQRPTDLAILAHDAVGQLEGCAGRASILDFLTDLFEVIRMDQVRECEVAVVR